MEQARRDRTEVLRQLRRMLRSKPNDAVKLAFLEDVDGVEGLDLTGLAEFRRTDKGGVEIRLVDRASILRELAALADSRPGERAEEFFKALEE